MHNRCVQVKGGYEKLRCYILFIGNDFYCSVIICNMDDVEALLDKIADSTLQQLRIMLKEYEAKEEYENCKFVQNEILIRQEKRQVQEHHDGY